MRDFRDAKAMAKQVRAGLAAKGMKISIAESLELIARAFGAADWNTLSAAIRAAGEAKQAAEGLQSNQTLDRLATALGLADWDELAGMILRAGAVPATTESEAAAPGLRDRSASAKRWRRPSAAPCRRPPNAGMAIRRWSICCSC